MATIPCSRVTWLQKEHNEYSGGFFVQGSGTYNESSKPVFSVQILHTSPDVLESCGLYGSTFGEGDVSILELS